MKRLIILSFLLFITLNASENKISQAEYNKLKKAEKFIKNNEFNNASNILKNVLNEDSNKLTKSYVYQSLANINIQKNNYLSAIKYYEKIVNLNALSKEDIKQIKYSLSQLYLSEGKYSKSVKYSKEVLNSGNFKKNKIYENLALAYFYNEQYSKSIKYLNLIISLKKEKIQWNKMLYSAYVETRNYSKAAKIMKNLLLKDKSNEDYWLQLISLYQSMKNYKKSLATIELAYKKGIINKSKNLMHFVNLLIQNNLYNKAGITLKRAIKSKILKNNRKNFNLMISSFLNAKNYKESLYLLNNSKYANTSKYKLILANIYFNKNNYKNALKVLRNFEFEKNTKNNGQKHIIMALSAYGLNNKELTIKHLKKAYKNKYKRKEALTIAKNLGYNI